MLEHTDDEIAEDESYRFGAACSCIVAFGGSGGQLLGEPYHGDVGR